MSRELHPLLPPFERRPSTVAIRRVQNYQEDLAQILWETLAEFELPVRGKSVLLKPNFVESDRLGCINTHPALVGAARECFLRMGADSVRVGDGPGHDRDTEAVLEAVRLREYIGKQSGVFVDLNLDDATRVDLRTRASSLKQLYFPNAVLGADFIVSMPKMKTHHWAGVTLSMKNMFGIVPGGCYGWPKNILHWAGIDKSILDINSTVPPDFAIVDGIIGMEGNGPIQGTPKAAGVLVVGGDPVAVDATCARVMGLRPERVSYLQKAGQLLGHIAEEQIRQIGEGIQSVRTPFTVLEAFQSIRV
ncbi:MAG: DUF362 domain-containing protein [Candidatus Acidiferrales bacterium]